MVILRISKKPMGKTRVTNVRYQIMGVLKGIAAVLPIMKKTTIWSYLKEIIRRED